MKQTLIVTCLLLAFAGVSIAQKNSPGTGNTAPRPAAAAQSKDQGVEVSDSFVIGLEDVLSVNVWREPELSVPSAVVRPDGKITIPLVGDVQASGLTTKQLQQNLSDKLKQYVNEPTVTVRVEKVESQKVSIVGNVTRPGAYSLGAPMTVLELIAKAGGLIPDFAHGKKIKIVRKRDGRTLLFNYNDAINGKNLTQNVLLENGDIVLVP